MDVRPFLVSLPLFRGLDPIALEALAAEIEIRPVAAGVVLLQQGDISNALEIVAAGRLRLYVRQPDGSQVPGEALTVGDCVGDMSLLASQPSPATVTAVEESQLYCLSRAAYERLAAAHPSLVASLVSALLPRYQRFQARLILTSLFGALDESALAALQEQLTWRHLSSGEVLYRQGETGDEMAIVVQGRLRFAVQDGEALRDLGEVGAGETIGEFALLVESGVPESLRSATVYATRQTDVVIITRQVFEGLLCQYPQALLQLTRRIVRREVRISQRAPAPAGALVITLLPAQPGLALGEFGRQLKDSFGRLGPALFFDAGLFEQRYGKEGAAQTPLDHPSSLVIKTWLDERERQQRVVIYDPQPVLDRAGHFTPWAQRCIEDADILLLVAEGGADPTPAAVEAALPAARTRARLELALLHPASCLVPSGTTAWLASRRTGAFPAAAHHHVRLGRAADYRRLARRLSGQPLGLALSGGGARGWAHIGVIKALEEAGLEVDWVGGASIGAILAAGYALDWSMDHITGLAQKFSDPKKLLDYTFPYTSITATRRITALIQELVGEITIEDTWRPFFCVSSNLTRGEEQVHTSGLLWKAVRASMAFPAIFAPIADEGCVLIDGGAANNLPLDRMRERCPTGTVIGVDLLTGSPVGGQYDFGSSLSGWGALRARLFPFSRQARVPNLLDIVAGVVYSNNRYRLNETWRSADLLIEVPVDAYGLLEFDKYAALIDLGYATAREQLQAFMEAKPGVYA